MFSLQAAAVPHTLYTMDLMQLLLRASLWVRRRPSREFAYAALAVVGLVLFVLLVENTVGWPENWQVTKTPRVPIR